MKKSFKALVSMDGTDYKIIRDCEICLESITLPVRIVLFRNGFAVHEFNNGKPVNIKRADRYRESNLKDDKRVDRVDKLKNTLAGRLIDVIVKQAEHLSGFNDREKVYFDGIK